MSKSDPSITDPASNDPAASLTSGDDALAHIFMTPEGLADPAPFYRYLREHAPLHESAAGALFLSRYTDCRETLRDNALGKSNSPEGLLTSGDTEALQVRREQLERSIKDKHTHSMLFLNPPGHTRQRTLVSRAFTPRRVEALRASIRVLADRMVDDFVASGGGDLMESVAFPLPVAVIGTMVGVPEADWPQFRSLITASAAGLEPSATADELRAAATSSAEVRAYFDALLIERRNHPQDDLLSDLIQVEDEGDRLTDGEIVAVSTLLFAAGLETTTNLIGNGVGALLSHPDQMAALWKDPSLVTTAVDEMLRWDSPVQLDGRTVLEPTQIAGQPVEVGTRVMTFLERQIAIQNNFSDPDRFDITRDEGPPMSFASGIHYCLGANLARAEGQEVFSSLIERCAEIESAGERERRNRITLRGFNSVPVTVTAR